MAVWWFRATCFHGLKYLCVNREVLKQNYIMKTEMKASNECLYPTDVFLVSCGMGCKRITVSDIAYIEAMKDNCIIHMVDGKRYTQSCPMGDIEPELNPNMFKCIHRSFIVNISYIDMYYYGHVVLELAQIMGFNYQVSGCKSVSEFVEMMTESEGKQLELFVRFIKGNRWDGYLRNLDWKEFARHYNGSGYAQNQYDKRLEKAYAKYK